MAEQTTTLEHAIAKELAAAGALFAGVFERIARDVIAGDQMRGLAQRIVQSRIDYEAAVRKACAQ